MLTYRTLIIFVSLLQLWQSSARKHYLRLENEQRPIIHISQFGFFRGGILEVHINELTLKESTIETNTNLIGFTVDKTLTDGITPYPHTMDDSNCALRLDKDSLDGDGVHRIAFAFDLKANVVKVGCSHTMDQVRLYSNISDIPFQNHLSSKSKPISMTNRVPLNRKKRATEPNPPASGKPAPASGLPMTTQTPKSEKNEDGSSSGNHASDPQPQLTTTTETTVVSPKGSFVGTVGQNTEVCKGHTFPLTRSRAEDAESDLVSYSTQFVVYVAQEESEGSYSLYFHHCGVEISTPERLTLDLNVVEQNRDRNYLSADEIPLPALYTMMSILFFVSGCFWVFILKQSRKETGVAVYKIHYLMGALVFVKSLSLLFHAINYHSIEVYGTHVEAWAILYYVTHLLKGALLFITILLIGTGYAFVKHLLSDKDKKIFMIVIPLQILANVAEIMTTEISEEGQMVHATWKIIFISVDLLCCGAILFPVVWSIRHLQEASQTDGKAASNLRKLKLFRHFYMIVVCYIYFTRIIVHMLLKITVPFQYKWLDPMVYEMATFIFFVLSGYKFRPAKNNPYLQLAHDSDDDEEMDVALTESGLTAGVTKRGPARKKKTLKEMIIFDPNEEETDDDEEVLLEKRREASHDFD